MTRPADTMIVPPDELETEASDTVLQAPEEPVAHARRVRLVLIVLALLVIVAALVVWWLVRR